MEEIYDEVPRQVETDKTKEAILVGATTKPTTMKMSSSSSISSSDNEKKNKKHKTSKTKPVVVEEKKVKKVTSSDDDKKKRKVSKKKDEAPAVPKVTVEEMLSQVILDGPGIGVIRVDKPVHFYIKPKLVPMNLVSVNVLCELFNLLNLSSPSLITAPSKKTIPVDITNETEGYKVAFVPKDVGSHKVRIISNMC